MPAQIFYYVYILRSLKDSKFYIGFTKDLRRRLEEHNNKMSTSTKSRAPFTLVYYEAYLHSGDAKERERFFKSGWGRNYIKKSLKRYLCQ
ncbi:MAG: GIY-YIG nuclease family protein [Patescibacteria group bacterium]|nr:GIY-YIG nuclease family protein [Patescibacteria group bacterium]MDD5164618.1 GIY-YIG nuclease family protein [Patescibacteria group bacterium]MDD5534540.1 GIY-YIG nuclease family protein [Patescibacteria group bacterium]